MKKTVATLSLVGLNRRYCFTINFFLALSHPPDPLNIVMIKFVSCALK